MELTSTSSMLILRVAPLNVEEASSLFPDARVRQTRQGCRVYIAGTLSVTGRLTDATVTAETCRKPHLTRWPYLYRRLDGPVPLWGMAVQPPLFVVDASPRGDSSEESA